VPPGIAASAPDRETAAPAGPAGPDDDTWVGLSTTPLDGEALTRWATTPDVGAVVTFHGTVRDHAPGRDDVSALTYEAYEEAAVARLAEVVVDVRRRWPAVRRVAAVHRTGRLEVGEAAVVVVAASAHRGDAFAAAAHCIDTLKATVPLWKKETWADGEEWGTDATAIEDVR
jgi:molybdopterin synthase catalytic subunit